MFFASFWMLRGVPVQAEDSTSASEERIVYSFTDGSGSYLVQKGERWYLRDANGKALTGIQYLAIKKNDVLMRGYYMFNSNGKLIRKRGSSANISIMHMDRISVLPPGVPCYSVHTLFV